MAATKDDIRSWLKRATATGALTHVVVVCDTYDFNDFPVYCASVEQVQFILDRWADKYKVMEVYRLDMDLENQLNEDRAWHI